MSKEENIPLRKEGRKRGEITQKMVSFRCDADNVDWLNSQPNKGRYINSLIARDRIVNLMTKDKDGH